MAFPIYWNFSAITGP